MKYTDDIKTVASLQLPWEKLSGCNILVTGATGLIGSCLIEVLMEHSNKDYHVYASGRNEARAMRRFSKYGKDPYFHFFQYDVTEPLKGEEQFHYIIHAASNASPNFFANMPVEVIKANIDGVANLIEYGMIHGLQRLLFVSSGEVYGEGDGRIFTEDYSGYVNCASVRACYPSSKRAAETLCVAYAHQYGVDVSIARLSHVFGPNFTEDDNRVYAQFIRNVLRGEDIVMKSTGEQFRSWCYVVDCVSAILHILLKGEKGQAYNVADNESNISIKELAETIAEIGHQKVVIDLPTETEKLGFNVVKKSIFSTQKLEGLGWHTIEGSIKNNLKKTIDELSTRNKK
jgi:nucleoside-diphosphate-sugar epimerase